MYENIPGHLLDPENLKPAGRLIDRADPALTEILQALTGLAGQLGNITAPDEDTICLAIRLGGARHAQKAAP
ncbi:hypothetical protein OHB49_45015 (plasmid) [Streptomyces sp. NBC_01717]|uniref:hypothetical protein n=1 Tax=Streptomyces sp. NBC_01717 TaxID=2975918 RepID=UPI002E3803F7|nr:hypothetical protein [Streptomyces sp. NBC_01717]